ncbi:hypothetical protein F2P81_025045 [Scophthalmus maximus]|uniref:Uncharacterized protein n=1 Tax=Scophthalmus maximus TaxID=52904 RepID=A0A6A4RLC1_SCOMX|nr:hypothetical protein F2P81_025045 [Scophthalmus maximus]
MRAALSRSARSRSSELVESLKLMSLCLSSQLQQHRGGRGQRGKLIIDPCGLSGGRGQRGKLIIDPCGVKIQEKSSWKMCIGSSGSLDTITLPTTAALPRSHSAHHHHHHRKSAGPAHRNAHSNLSSLKNGMLQLPLCEKTISVNIQRGGGSRDGLLCTATPASCCQVI